MEHVAASGLENGQLLVVFPVSKKSFSSLGVLLGLLFVYFWLSASYLQVNFHCSVHLPGQKGEATAEGE